MTVTSKLQANAERNKEIEKRQKREEKAASFGGAVRDYGRDDVYVYIYEPSHPFFLRPSLHFFSPPRPSRGYKGTTATPGDGGLSEGVKT